MKAFLISLSIYLSIFICVYRYLSVGIFKLSVLTRRLHYVSTTHQHIHSTHIHAHIDTYEYMGTYTDIYIYIYVHTYNEQECIQKE